MVIITNNGITASSNVCKNYCLFRNYSGTIFRNYYINNGIYII